MRLMRGRPQPLGATKEAGGTNFAVFATNATQVQLCLQVEEAEHCLTLTERTGDVWHGFLPDTELPTDIQSIGLGYGFRVVRAAPPSAPSAGARGSNVAASNTASSSTPLLLDPYARATSGPEQVVEIDGRRTLAAPWGLVLGDRPQLQHPRPNTPLSRSVIYETHVRGLTMQHPEVPEELRGTYAGLAHPAVVKYLGELGITAVELLPVHAHVDDMFLRDKGLSNYWGYSTLGYFAPEPRYSAAWRSGNPAGAEAEFAGMVDTLHAAGLEVLLDVVYNHTAEGGLGGPILSQRGFAPEAYYFLGAHGEYLNHTGTGNALRLSGRASLQLVLDSLHHWAALGVDGFRFDLATTLTRGECAGIETGPDMQGHFLAAVQADPVLRELKLIAEPWDIGPGGYQLGQFPPPWAEWNDRYRDCVRGFWRGDAGRAGEMGFRLTGSSDIFAPSHRHPQAGINFIAAHDGFTLRDMVSYAKKHNEANGEHNRDGHSHNLSCNMGVEGATDNPQVLAARARQQRNLLATLLLSQGVPMLLGGDEVGRSKGGNNNSYAQDNATNWYDWETIDRPLLEFTRRMIALRQGTPLLRQTRFFTEQMGQEANAASWWRFDGAEMSNEDWANPQTKSLGLLLTNAEGEALFMAFNASPIALPFTLPNAGEETIWRLEVDTCNDHAEEMVRASKTTLVLANSLKVFSRQRPT